MLFACKRAHGGIIRTYKTSAGSFNRKYVLIQENDTRQNKLAYLNERMYIKRVRRKNARTTATRNYAKSG